MVISRHSWAWGVEVIHTLGVLEARRLTPIGRRSSWWLLSESGRDESIRTDEEMVRGESTETTGGSLTPHHDLSHQRRAADRALSPSLDIVRALVVRDLHRQRCVNMAPPARSRPTDASSAGASTLRAGFASESYPSYTLDNLGAKYRDRKSNRTITLAGSEAFVDATSRAAIKSPFEGDVVCNFDQMVRSGVLVSESRAGLRR